jgi:hypothetical protein
MPHIEIWGDRVFLNRPVREVFPDLDGQSFFELLDSVYKSTTPHIGRRMPISFQSGDKPARTAFLDFVYQPIMDDIGNVSGIFVQGTDVTDLREAEFALRNKDLQLTLALMLRQMALEGRSEEFSRRQTILREGTFQNLSRR